MRLREQVIRTNNLFDAMQILCVALGKVQSDSSLFDDCTPGECNHCLIFDDCLVNANAGNTLQHAIDCIAYEYRMILSDIIAIYSVTH